VAEIFIRMWAKIKAINRFRQRDTENAGYFGGLAFHDIWIPAIHAGMTTFFLT